MQRCQIEVVAVAGAGKSTLSRTLGERYSDCRTAEPFSARAPGHWPRLAHSLPRLVPLLARTTWSRPSLSWDEFKAVIYVSEWDRLLRTRARYRSGLTVLDQGPIFSLARLLWGGKPVTRSRSFRAWLERMLECWSAELDAIVWLDAPDPILLDRIRHRDQRHEARDKPTPEALELIASHREAYRQLLARIERLGRPQILRFDTSCTSPSEIAEALGRRFQGSRAS
jgi:shikimate kinase